MQFLYFHWIFTTCVSINTYEFLNNRKFKYALLFMILPQCFSQSEDLGLIQDIYKENGVFFLTTFHTIGVVDELLRR